MSTKTLVGPSVGLDAIQLAQEIVAFGPPRLDPLVERDTLLAQGSPHLVEGTHGRGLAGRDEHALARFHDGDQIALLDAQAPPDLGGEGDLAVFLDADELGFCRHRRCFGGHSFR